MYPEYPAPEARPYHAQVSTPDERYPLIASVAAQPLAFAAGLALAVCMATAVAQWPGELSLKRAAQYVAAWAQEGIDFWSPEVAAAEPKAVVPGNGSQVPSMQAPVKVALERTPLPPPVPAPRLVAGAIEGPLATMLHVPLRIENAARLDRNSILLVTNVPDYTALSLGQPLGAGTWVVPASRVGDLGIIAYAQPASRQRLAFELLSRDGELISTATTSFSVAEPERADHPSTTLTGGPASTKKQARLADSSMSRRR
jgi:hypothetical protein